MSEPVAMKIAAEFTSWLCKSRGTLWYNGTPGYRVLHQIYFIALRVEVIITSIAFSAYLFVL